ncbi:NAD-P-binding protein [Stereum hirsutum FP-91666 SS1]|uniref:NAD-P-binding protein n=1 Tax=Stereum hirsutum (strain FP-91666) TaxID=721885 RepID=UPI000440DD65|nr:NAD-P-binding protein [Stereum hirsutum FP-91666 SS1]EIM86366.1 NAD-P-binding protein [Stereum hirsutum FP-91666 SS1]
MSSATGNRVAFITGAAAQGLGRSIALRLAEDGFSLALNDLLSKKDILEDLQAQILKSYSDKHPGQKCMITTGDVSSEEDVKRMVEEAVEELGSLNVMVANAGILPGFTSFLDTSLKDLDRMLSINLKGVFLCYQYAARQMIKQGRGGRIIGACSIAGKQGHPMASAYSTSKFAVPAELGQYGITVNAYAPGFTSTDMLRNLATQSPDSKTFYTNLEDTTVLCRLGKPEEIAALVSFLASENSSFITGQSIVVDGGRIFD